MAMSYNGVEAPDNGSQRTSDLPFYPAFLSIAHPLTDEDSWFWGVEVVYRRLCSSSQVFKAGPSNKELTEFWQYTMSATQQDVQTEKAFQRQHGASQLALAQSSKRRGKARYWREVGLGFATPRLAKEGTYVDKKCPFTGNVSIRGRIIKGMVISAKMKRCVVIRRTYLHFVRKYSRVEKRHKNVTCHLSPCFEQVKEGDIVTAGQCRPLSKTIRFNVLKVESNQVFGNVRKQFRLF